MKVICILLISGILFGCSPEEPVRSLPSERIIRFSYGDQTLGYGVASSEIIFTASHVIDRCTAWDCTFDSRKLGDSQVFRRGDLSSIGDLSMNNISDGGALKVGDNVYVLRSLSGTWKRVDTLVSAIDVSYIGYDATLSGVYLSGALEIGIALDVGESGLPVWTHSGELVGVVSASDVRAGKSYVVK